MGANGKVFDSRPRWGLGTIFNLLLTAAVLDHALTHRFVPCRDVSYARSAFPYNIRAGVNSTGQAH